MDSTLLAAIIGAMAGIVGTYLGAVVKFRRDLELEYNKDLRSKRIDKYCKLWNLTDAFPKYERQQPLTIKKLQCLQADLQRWYFEEGGLFLSDRSSPVYFSFKDALQDAIKSAEPDDRLNPDTDAMLYQIAKGLRLALAKDVGTRQNLELP